MKNYLKQFKETTPDWLMKYQKGDEVTFDKVMDGRVGYYPGSGLDGNLVAVANKAHCVHSFLYVDYMVSREELIKELQVNPFQGYHSIGRIDWSESDLMPNRQFPIEVNYTPNKDPKVYVNKNVTPFCFTEILERDADKNEEWGSERFAITFLFADGIAAYYQLFVKQFVKAPWLFLLQDHGFGGNYDWFGKNGCLDAIIKESNIRPEYVICACQTDIWNGYKQVKKINPTYGGMHNYRRDLFKKS